MCMCVRTSKGDDDILCVNWERKLSRSMCLSADVLRGSSGKQCGHCSPCCDWASHTLRHRLSHSAMPLMCVYTLTHLNNKQQGCPTHSASSPCCAHSHHHHTLSHHTPSQHTTTLFSHAHTTHHQYIHVQYVYMYTMKRS